VCVPPARRISRFASEIRGRRGGEFHEAPAGVWRAPCRHVSQFDIGGPKVRPALERAPAQKAAGVSGVSSRALCFLRLFLSCDMLLVRYDSGVADPPGPPVLSLTMPRDAFVAAPSLGLLAARRFIVSRRREREGASFKGATIIARTVPRAPGSPRVREIVQWI